MITPTIRAVALAAAGAPIALGLGLLRPELWTAGAGWAAFVLGLVLVDAVLGADRRKLALELDAPVVMGVGRPAGLTVGATLAGGVAPRSVEITPEVGERLTARPLTVRTPVQAKAAGARFELDAVRRGVGELPRVWVRWTGPLGMAAKQVAWPAERTWPITPDVVGVKEEALRLFARDASFGMKVQLETGDGSDFHALKEHQAGMDLRTVDWKQSARHNQLLAREFRTERNNPVILAVDAGRLMCEPLDGLPKVDRMLNAALLLAFTALKTGDRVGFFAFDERPRGVTGALSGVRAFAQIQRLASAVDYSDQEANYTLALTTLQGELERRSLIVVFTDFADPTSAELLLENAGRLLKRHVLLFVLLRDAELEDLARAAPDTPEAVSRAVVAGRLLRERAAVVARLRRLGAEIVEAPARAIGAALISGYLDIRRRERL